MSEDSRLHRPSTSIRIGQNRVVVYGPGSAEVHPWAEALEGCKKDVVETIEALDHALARPGVRVVVCGWEPGLWDRIQTGCRGARIVFCGSNIPDAALEDVGAGHRVLHAASPEELQEKVLLGLRTPRASPRHKVAGLRVVVGKSARHLPLLDLSNQGLTFQLPSEEPLDDYLPGTVLEALRVWRGDRIVVEGVDAEVRNVAPMPEGYRIGCALLLRRAAHQGSASRVSERAVCAGLLRAAIAERSLVLRAQEEADSGLRCSGEGEVLLDERRIVLGEPPGHGFATSDVVHGTFEREGCLYRFTTVVLGVAPLELRMPASLEQVRRRAAERHHFDDGAGPEVEIHVPALDTRVVRPIRDLGGAGLSFYADTATDLFPLGLVLDPMIIRLDGHTIRCRGEVRTHTSLNERRSRFRCGVAFKDLDEATRVRIADYITQQRFPNLSDAGDVDLTALLSLFERTGFVNEAKRRLLAPLLPRIEDTFRKLGSRATPLFKSFVTVGNEGPTGYVSGIRTYASTFQLQHLAAIRGQAAAGPLVRAVIEHVLHQTDYAYAMFWFVRENPFPSRVFGGFGRRALDPDLCDMRQYAHVTLTERHDLGQRSADLRVAPASGGDLEIVERHLIARLGGLLVRAHDLTRTTLSLRSVDESYWELGLSRRRHVFLAHGRSGPVGFALAELSSPGLNLSEGLSSFRLFVLPEGEAQGDDVRRALLAALRDFYSSAGRAFALGLVDPADVPSFERVGLPCEAVSYGCTAHRSQLRLFAEHTARVTIRR